MEVFGFWAVRLTGTASSHIYTIPNRVCPQRLFYTNSNPLKIAVKRSYHRSQTNHPVAVGHGSPLQLSKRTYLHPAKPPIQSEHHFLLDPNEFLWSPINHRTWYFSLNTSDAHTPFNPWNPMAQPPPLLHAGKRSG